ncbi:BLUF domain-containing protein [Coraliomargarita sinensis]|nr:BLUF domain-containing protein [Coraliomargarita sinensis]
MSDDLYQIIYISTANAGLTEDSLLELLSASQKRNAARQITGILLHSDGNIIQVIEGPEAKVKGLYEKISDDPRHRGVTLISGRSVQRRDFPKFKMGFKRARSKDFKAQLPGFTDVVEKGKVTDEELAGLSKLVSVFIRTFAKSTNIDRFGC